MNAKELRLSDSALLAERDRQRAAKRAAKARTAPRRKPGAEKKRISREERNATLAKIRADAFAEWMGHCALCFGTAASGTAATDLHHVLSGPERRLHESAETVLPVCRTDHRLLHDGDLETLRRARNVCHVNEMHRAVAALDRRIWKAQEARASSLRAQDGEGETRRPSSPDAGTTNEGNEGERSR